MKVSPNLNIFSLKENTAQLTLSLFVVVCCYLLSFVVCCCLLLTLFVVGRCLSLVVVCCCLLFVVGSCFLLVVVWRCLLLFFVGRWSLFVVGRYCRWSLFVVVCFCLLFVVCCCLLWWLTEGAHKTDLSSSCRAWLSTSTIRISASLSKVVILYKEQSAHAWS